MKWADLVAKEITSLSDEKDGFKLYPNAKFPFTKERADEFSAVTLETLIDDPYYLNQKWDGNQGVWPAIKDILLDFEQERKKRILNTFLFTSGIGGGKCNKYNSLCITEKGILTSEEIYNDDSVLQMVSESGLKPIESKLEEGELDGIELTFNNGITQTTTGHHRLRVWTNEAKIEWKKVDDIQIGDYVIFAPNINNVWGNRTEIDGFELTETRCEVMGLWIAEGLKSSKNCVEIVSGEKKEELDKLFNSANIRYRMRLFTSNAYHYIIYDDFAKIVNKYFKSGSKNKEIPKFIRELPKHLLCAFLRGMFAGDGSFITDIKNGRGAITYTTTSKRLIEQLSVLLIYLGIKFNFKEDNRPNRKNYNTSYNIVIRSNSERIKFKELIGTIFERRINALNTCCFDGIKEKSRGDVIPFADNLLKITNIPIEFKYKTKEDYNKIKDIQKKLERNNINIKNIAFLLSQNEDKIVPILKHIYNNGYWIVKVVDKKIVKERMYDFTVQDDPSYISNGVINHNTSVASIMLYWQLYDLLTLPNTNQYYGLMEGKMIAFCILSKDADAARKVTFIDFIPIIAKSPFIKDYFPPQISLEKITENPRTMPRELRFPKNITIFPGTGQAASALGYNIYGGCFTADTKIKLANGDIKSFKELENEKNLILKGFDCKTHQFVDTKADSIKLTKKNEEIFEIKMTDGYTFRATKNQRILTFKRDNYNTSNPYKLEYSRVDELTAIDEIPTNSFFCNYVYGIKPAGREDVYDVINSETENFLLENGTIVHNSMDEVNDMAWVESSTKARMKQYYSAAEESYREITERMNSRFPWETLYRQQKKHGFITCIGQARFPDSFTEKKILEAQILGNESTIYYIRTPRWALQPKERFSRETFLIDKTNKRVIEFLPINRYPDLAEKKCQYCFNNLTNGAYIANNGILVDTIDCYKQSFLGKIDVEKETA